MTKDPFQFWNKNAILKYAYGDSRLYEMDGERFLFVDQIMYASTTERGWYLRHLTPRARGNCLELGLGLGVASRAILLNHFVESLLTIEKNLDVIKIHGKAAPRQEILWADVNVWVEDLIVIEPIYDLIFVDHYTLEDEETIDELEVLAGKLKLLLTDKGSMVFWIDINAPDEDQLRIKNLWVDK